jgi:hypothetical protein
LWSNPFSGWPDKRRIPHRKCPSLLGQPTHLWWNDNDNDTNSLWNALNIWRRELYVKKKK